MPTCCSFCVVGNVTAAGLKTSQALVEPPTTEQPLSKAAAITAINTLFMVAPSHQFVAKIVHTIKTAGVARGCLPPLAAITLFGMFGIVLLKHFRP